MGRTRLDATEADSLYGGIGHHGRGLFHRSGEDRIEHLEGLQRDLEETTADVASHLEYLRRRESD